MIIHTVRSGDSIFSISREYGIPATRIISDNLLTNPSSLVVGQTLVLQEADQVHTVRGGETLSSIAEQYAVSLNTLYRNNPVLGGKPLVYPGQSLIVTLPQKEFGEISVNGYAYPNISLDVLRRTLPYLTYLSVFSYGIREDGTLLEPGGGEETLLSLAKEYGAVPILVLTSLGEDGRFSSETVARVLTDEALSDRIATELAATVKEKGYGGVDIDFEYIPAEFGSAYGDFLSAVEEALGSGYEVFVSLAPKNRADQPGLLYEGHVYPLLGEIADRSLLMTYEWGYTYGPPMAVSPVDLVRRVVEYAVGEIAPEKILLGVPNYGYNWPLPYVRGETVAKSLGNVEAVELALGKQAAISFDEVAQSPYFTYYDRPESYADAVQHVVWFEDALFSDAMLRLIPEYTLGGASVWNLTKYFPALWLVFNNLFSIRQA